MVTDEVPSAARETGVSRARWLLNSVVCSGSIDGKLVELLSRMREGEVKEIVEKDVSIRH